MTHKQPCNIYIASCTEDGGIYQYCLLKDGNAEFVEFTPMDRPMYMVISNGKMYVLLRAPFADNPNSGLVVYDILENGKLANPSEIVSTKGEVACHLSVDEENIYCTNYISGSVIKMPMHIIKHSGKGVNPDRQTGAHPHFAGVTPDKKYVCIADLGLDTVFMYDKELNLISEATVPAGHGARHLAFSGDFLYCANELKSTLSVFKLTDKKLEYKNTVSVLPDDYFKTSTLSAIRVKEKLCYVANRGHDSISVLDISEEQPKLITTVPCGGSAPRDFNIIDDILICANEKSDNVSFFKLVNGVPQRISEELKIKGAFCVVY